MSILSRLAAVITALTSLAVVVAEATMYHGFEDLSVFSRVLHRTSGNQFSTEIITFVFLLYPCVCAYYALYK